MVFPNSKQEAGVVGDAAVSQVIEVQEEREASKLRFRFNPNTYVDHRYACAYKCWHYYAHKKNIFDRLKHSMGGQHLCIPIIFPHPSDMI